METNDISKYVYFEVVNEKSAKGKIYNALYLCIRDKNSNLIYRYLLTFLTNNKYETLLSLIANKN